ncbi:MAG: hypothetical protein M1830_005804 [Pleopsidium flavum]|nr:MAG: hypothetical protein M1830_005804 [Pleopsidium flavum]
MTLGSPARSIGYIYTQSTTSISYYLGLVPPSKSIERTEPPSSQAEEELEIIDTRGTGIAIGSTSILPAMSGNLQSEPASLFQWRVDDTSYPPSQHHDTSSGLSTRAASTRSSSPATPSSGAQSPIRGRSLDILGVRHGLVSHATARRKAGPSSVEFDSGLMQARVASRDFTAEPDVLRGNTSLDPYQTGRANRSVSEAFFGHTIHGFAGHRDTFALLAGLPKLAPDLPLEFLECLRAYISHADYLSLRLSCRAWSSAISYVSPPKLPAVYFVPTEILQQVYSNLRPVDFNAARHTCRAWMLASLERHLLTSMLKRGGWWEAITTDTASYRPPSASEEAISEEWVLSKRLARECSLGPEWTGNGFSRSPSCSSAQAAVDSFDTSLLHNGSRVLLPPAGLPDTASMPGRDMTSLTMTSLTDFSELGSGYVGEHQQGSAVNFTVSVCSRFVLVAEGCMIYIYKLRSDDKKNPGEKDIATGLTAVTSILCPRRVLAASMDTSSQRFAIAALLDGRMGLVCDLDESPQPSKSQPPAWTSNQNTQGFHVAVSPSSLRSPFNRAFVRSSGSSSEREISQPALGDSNHSGSSRTWASDRVSERQAWHRISDSALDDSGSVLANSFSKEQAIRVQTGPRSIYKNLCSDDDPPRSVAICPQRRCVAFGCSTGIELHWIDALTGQDLNRWFPLAAPSDFLYFLPPRKGVDSAKKLRLISSAAHPNEKPAIRHHFYPAQTMSHLMWGRLSYTSHLAGVQGSSDCDHYRAVPLSDGNHILFTDPASGMLCLGNDAPLGGPTKLLRKIMLVGPEGCVPSVYAAGAELRCGVRAVAGYGDRLILFSIPPDVFRDCKAENVTDTSSHEDSWHNYLDDGNDSKVGSKRALWPFKIRGAEIGRVSNLSDLAIDSSPNFTIWAFSANGEAFLWQIGNGSPQRLKKISILQGGRVAPTRDADGDIIMSEAPPLAEDYGRRSVGFDGTSSVSFPFLTPGDYVLPSSSSADSLPQESGDVEMTDADTLDHSEFAQAGGAFAISIPPVSARWSEAEADWVPDYLQGEELDEGVLRMLGLARLECEVL